VKDGPQAWAAQSGFDVRLCWGPAGVQALGAEVDAVVVVDILRFTSALDVAVGTGAEVFPHPWPVGPHSPDPYPEGAEVADATGPRALSLSPATLTGLRAGERIVLPSANGSHCSALAAGSGAAVVGASLRNAGAVARWLLHTTAGSPAAPIAIVPCGERWPDGSLRPAVEDLIGAGALVAALRDGAASLSLSPEASAAMAAFESTQSDLWDTMATSTSGRELRAKGYGDDVEWAAALNVSSCVPVLGPDGAYVAAAAPS
jgi:2-phosphosulfolactate phosphatase